MKEIKWFPEREIVREKIERILKQERKLRENYKDQKESIKKSWKQEHFE